MRLDVRSVVGVFSGSAVLGRTTAGQEDICGGEVNQRLERELWGEDVALQLCTFLRFNCKNCGTW